MIQLRFFRVEAGHDTGLCVATVGSALAAGNRYQSTGWEDPAAGGTALRVPVGPLALARHCGQCRADSGTRNRNLQLGRLALCHLSYARTV